MTKKILKATHEGILKIGGVSIPCYVLENGDRILSTRGIMKALGRRWRGRKYTGTQLPVFLEARNLKPFIDSSLDMVLTPTFFKPKRGLDSEGFKAEILPIICEAYLKARDAGVLTLSQRDLAKRCEISMRGFSRIGIIALVDEAAGFLEDKERFEYRELFKEFIRDQAAQYEKQFPDEFYNIFYKIYGYQRPANKNKRPLFFAKLTRKYVYEPLAGSDGAILEMLDEKNPIVATSTGTKKRKHKLFQFLEKIGKDSLQQHIWQLIGIGKASPNKTIFDRNFERTFSKNFQKSLFDE